jgi:hypothetical protein
VSTSTFTRNKCQITLSLARAMTVEESLAVIQVLIAHGWNVLYVIDDPEMLPDITGLYVSATFVTDF